MLFLTRSLKNAGDQRIPAKQLHQGPLFKLGLQEESVQSLPGEFLWNIGPQLSIYLYIYIYTDGYQGLFGRAVCGQIMTES